MRKTVFAVAQTRHEAGSIHATVRRHCDLVEIAARHGAGFILFPEMSITGYLREGAWEAAMGIDDPKLKPLAALASEKKICISVGLPLKADHRVFIASALFRPEGEVEVYTKKFLHPGEELHFAADNLRDPLTRIGQERIAHAICYDIEREEHLVAALKREPTIYSASIFYSRKGIGSGLERLAAISRTHRLAVLMSNYAGQCWNLESGGKSSIWSCQGEIVAQSRSHEECLLLGRRSGDSWESAYIDLGA